jgi:hypothetical protein
MSSNIFCNRRSLNASSPEAKWSVIRRKMPTITGSVRNANSSSTTSMRGDRPASFRPNAFRPTMRVPPVFGLNGQPKTFTALAITSAMVVTATRLCTAIIPFAQRASGMVSVGEKAIAFVRLTYR